MNSYLLPGGVIAAAVLLGSMFSAGGAAAAPDASLAQVFEAVCLKPVDAEGRQAAAQAQGLRTPPDSFQDVRPKRKGATLELNVWKAVERRMLIVYTMIEAIPGEDGLVGLSCQAMLSPGDPAALSDASAVLGLSFAADDKGSESAAFETTANGRTILDMGDDAAMEASMRSGRLNLVTLSRRNSKSDTDMIYLLRTQAP